MTEKRQGDIRGKGERVDPVENDPLPNPRDDDRDQRERDGHGVPLDPPGSDQGVGPGQTGADGEQAEAHKGGTPGTEPGASGHPGGAGGATGRR